jgi:glycosyltransferase involved in cell wall biosynthesis
MSKKVRILFIAMSNSIHTARWISQIADEGWDLHLFPSDDNGRVHPDLKNVTVHHSFYSLEQTKLNRNVRYRGIPLVSDFSVNAARKILRSASPDYRENQLQRLIRKISPDIIHSMEFQSGGYLAHDVKMRLKGPFPTWIATNWGSDIYLFGRMPGHRDRIKAVLSQCDYYSCECHRDVALARSLGFKGKVLPVLPNSGGYNLSRLKSIPTQEPVSARRLILLKGYQGMFGRAIVGVRAIGMSAHRLKGYRVAIYSAWMDESIKIAAQLMSQDTGLPVEIVPPCTHEDMMALFGQARIYLGLSISDAISTSLLEAMIMGTFPIQSNTSSAEEWVEHGISGLIVPPEDPETISGAIIRAVSEDALVDEASVINRKTAAERLDVSIIKPQVIAAYQNIFSQTSRRDMD